MSKRQLAKKHYELKQVIEAMTVIFSIEIPIYLFTDKRGYLEHCQLLFANCQLY